MSKTMNSFLKFMKLGDNDDDEEYYDDDYEIEDDEPVVKETPKKFGRNRYEEDDYSEPAPAKPEKVSKFSKPSSSKVVPMTSKTPSNTRTGLEVCVIKPTSMEDGMEISDTLNSGRAVILNLEGLQMDLAQRIIDFTSGACYSTGGNLQKISQYIFISTPQSVDVSGDFQSVMSSDYEFTPL